MAPDAGDRSTSDDAAAPRPDIEALAKKIEEDILGGPGLYTISEVADRAGQPQGAGYEQWNWLGFSADNVNARHFSDWDVFTLREYLKMAATLKFDNATHRGLVRALGYMTERLASWQVEAVIENLIRQHGLSDTQARVRALEVLPEIAPMIARQVERTWRREFAAATLRNTVNVLVERDGHEIGDELPLARAVGLVDAVGFTRKTAHLDHSELADFLEELSAQARDIIASHSGRLIKPIGDAALFVADDAFTGAEICLELVAEMEQQVGVELRGGMVWCRVLGRYGDVFGPGVNLAARLCAKAQPGQVLVDNATAKCLAPSPRYSLAEQPEVDLHGVGKLRPVELRYADAHGGEFTI